MTQDTSSSSFWGGGKGHDLLVEVAEPIYRSFTKFTSMAHWENFFNFFETARGAQSKPNQIQHKPLFLPRLLLRLRHLLL